MAKDPSIIRFLAELKETESGIEQAIKRFQLSLGLAILKQVQTNIKAAFGKDRVADGHPGKSAITERGYGGSARRGGRGGGLFGSAELAVRDGQVTVTVGGPGAPYAAIHETGGVITPKRAQWLTLPFNARFAGTRAREHDLRFARGVKTDVPGFEEIGAALILRGARQRRDGFVAASRIGYILAKRVTIPARPYFQPAVDAVIRGPGLRRQMAEHLGRVRIEVKVE